MTDSQVSIETPKPAEGWKIPSLVVVCLGIAFAGALWVRAQGEGSRTSGKGPVGPATGQVADFTGDGRSDIRDAEVLYRLIDAAAARPEAQGLIGGIGKYPPTAAHGPFVHVDVRDGKARW